jgi:hypothetical protein
MNAPWRGKVFVYSNSNFYSTSERMGNSMGSLNASSNQVDGVGFAGKQSSGRRKSSVPRIQDRAKSDTDIKPIMLARLPETEPQIASLKGCEIGAPNEGHLKAASFPDNLPDVVKIEVSDAPSKFYDKETIAGPANRQIDVKHIVSPFYTELAPEDSEINDPAMNFESTDTSRNRSLAVSVAEHPVQTAVASPTGNTSFADEMLQYIYADDANSEASPETHLEGQLSTEPTDHIKLPALPFGRSNEFRSTKTYSPYQSTDQLLHNVTNMTQSTVVPIIAPLKGAVPLLPPVVLALRGLKSRSTSSDLVLRKKPSSLHKSHSGFSQISNASKESIRSRSALRDKFGSSVYLSTEISSTSSIKSKKVDDYMSASQDSINLRSQMITQPEENGIRRPNRYRTAAIVKYRMKKFNSTSTLFVDRTIIDADILEILR